MLRHLRLLTVVAGVSLLASGCVGLVVAGAAGAAGLVYVGGEGKTTFPHDVDTVFNAALPALEQDMMVEVLDNAYDLTSGRIDAVRADGNKVKVRLYLKETDLTEVRVRVGTVGDKTWTRMFFGKLEGRLQG